MRALSGGAMPRKNVDQATAQARADQLARWRYFLRNPDFQKDMDALFHVLRNNTPPFDSETRRIADKWGLLRISGEAVIYWPGGRPHPED